MFEKIKTLLSKIKTERPLILNLTNYVTMDFIANGLLSLGASPIMSHAIAEIEDLIKISNVLVVNLGTLDPEFIELCLHAGKLANAWGKPIIFDPVGAGASQLRTATCQQFLEDHAVAIIRGNASEIMALAGSALRSKGVDTTIGSSTAIASAETLVRLYKTTVIISGETDYIIDANQLSQFNRGSDIMPLITGSGCLLTSLVGAFHAVTSNVLDAASTSCLFYSICGEIAAEKATGPGSFKVHFLDALHSPPQRKHYEKS
jgi:hydroxyethylthiazole kinase